MATWVDCRQACLSHLPSFTPSHIIFPPMASLSLSAIFPPMAPLSLSLSLSHSKGFAFQFHDLTAAISRSPHDALDQWVWVITYCKKSSGNKRVSESEASKMGKLKRLAIKDDFDLDLSRSVLPPGETTPVVNDLTTLQLHGLKGNLIQTSTISEYDLWGEGELFKAPEPIIEEPAVGLDPMTAAISMISCGEDVITPQKIKVADSESIQIEQLKSEVFYECKKDILAKEAFELALFDIMDIKIPVGIEENLISDGKFLTEESFQKSISSECLSSMDWMHGAPMRPNFLDFPGMDLDAVYGMRKAFSEGDIKDGAGSLILSFYDRLLAVFGVPVSPGNVLETLLLCVHRMEFRGRGRARGRGVLHDESEAAKVMRSLCRIRTQGGRGRGRGKSKVSRQEEQDAIVEDIPEDEVKIFQFHTRLFEADVDVGAGARAEQKRSNMTMCLWMWVVREDISLLKSFCTHVAKAILEGEERGTLRLHQHSGLLRTWVVTEDRNLGYASRRKTKQIGGFLILLEAWINEHFPTLHPVVDLEYTEELPRARRWCLHSESGTSVQHYRRVLDDFLVDEVEF
ncbi:hypothetical protein RHMOL_Rhmol06G0162000 [Rhododendron molle]|uniref:Uncharacterized protein n=2 Tax=Rhododendron molle TaxID=49168 RepID=A0ACC0ND59_RHOML|nr:hypothetical protein RHMOL_Rhmol06G0162000 [Rhododendron molle]